jgi:tryptophanyl-tRNA synthetase
MSKSATGSGHAIGLLDPPDQIRKKIMRATTDSQPQVDFEKLGAGVRNLIEISQAFMGWGNRESRAEFSGMRYGDLKKKVAEIVVSKVEPIQQRYREITSEPGYIDSVLTQGAERVSPIAKSTVRTVKERMGLYTGA